MKRYVDDAIALDILTEACGVHANREPDNADVQFFQSIVSQVNNLPTIALQTGRVWAMIESHDWSTRRYMEHALQDLAVYIDEGE